MKGSRKKAKIEAPGLQVTTWELAASQWVKRAELQAGRKGHEVNQGQSQQAKTNGHSQKEEAEIRRAGAEEGLKPR
ncbi:hypothetical protein Y1Q_0015471 [Alligator mississippiensis]|uniref:Uncharacterized protein n=1 Tax=Alligator mississippiensis TaxID=8496 RepID=A0A151ND13_ALLMI|nr:hypothetical protein Y1Q_0015471 [Alligator mississippiensis]